MGVTVAPKRCSSTTGVRSNCASRLQGSSTPAAPTCTVTEGRVVSSFIIQVLRHEPITIYGDGMQSESFCYGCDLVEGRVRCSNCFLQTTGGSGNRISAGRTNCLHGVHWWS